MKPLTAKLSQEVNAVQPSVQTEYWDSGLGAAGCIFIAKDTGRILLAHRNAERDPQMGYVEEPDTWGTWGGKIDDGESPKDAVVREVEEETGYNGDYKLAYLWTYEDPSEDFQYHNYLAVVSEEFLPKRSWENDRGKWVEWGEWPQPMHFGLKALLQNAGDKIHRVVTLIKHKHATVVESAVSITKESIDAPPAIVQPANATANYNITNAYIVVTTLWGEARGEGERGMQAVMNVIMNRAKGDFKRAKDVVLEPKQFSVWNHITNAEKTAIAAARKYRDNDSWQQAIRIVDLASKGKLPDITDGATFYFNPKKANPAWAKKMIKIISIGNHDFYKPRKMVRKTVPSVIREMIETQDPNKSVIFPKGLVGDGVWAYELRSPKSYIRYRHEPDTKIFYLDNVGTPLQTAQHKGYVKALLETFFQLIKQYGGALDSGPYTGSGIAYVKHVVERLSKQYGVRLVQGRNPIDETWNASLPQFMYHGTFGALIDYIKKDGIIPRGGGDAYNFDCEWGVYLTVTKDRAAEWPMETENENVPEEWFDDIVILTIDTTKLDKDGFDADPQIVMHKKDEQQSFIYRDKIPPSAIVNVERAPGSKGKSPTIESRGVINEDLYEYFYHATTPDALPGIVSKGLIPSDETHWGGDLGKFSEGKVFVAKNFRQANYYGNIIWRGHPNRYRPILRFKYNKHRFIPDKQSTGDLYVEYPLKAKFEIFVYDENTKIEYGNQGDTFFKESTGHWRPLTRNLASAIMTGEWDGEEGEDIDEAYGDPGDHVIFGGVFYPERVVANIVKSSNDYFGHTYEHGPTRWVYYQKIKTVFWHTYPPAIPEWEVIVKEWLEKRGYKVTRQTDREQYYKIMQWYNDKGLLKEGVRVDYINRQIQTLEAEWDKLDSQGTGFNRQQQISAELAQLRKEKERWEKLYSAVGAINEGVFAARLNVKYMNHDLLGIVSKNTIPEEKPYRFSLFRTDSNSETYGKWEPYGHMDLSEEEAAFLVRNKKFPTIYNNYNAMFHITEQLANKELLAEIKSTPKALEEFLREQIKGTEWAGKVFAVGGFVRDELLGKEPKDLDIVVGKNQGGVEFTTWLGKKLGIYKPGSNPVIFPTFGTANLRLDGVVWNGFDFSGETIDAVMFRKEQYHDPNTRKPTVQFTPSIETEASRRDLTFNAIYKDIASGQIIDPTGKGISDLKNGIVRTPIDPTIIYTDDALRMFRAVRFAAQLGFELSPEIVNGIKKNLHRLHNTSRERMRDELNKILLSKGADRGLRLLQDTGLLAHLSPDLQKMVGMTQNKHHSEDVFSHTLSVVSKTKPILIRRLGALLHDIGKVATRQVIDNEVHFYSHEEVGVDIAKKIMVALKYPNDIIDPVILAVRNHMRMKRGGKEGEKLTDKSIRKLIVDLGEHLNDIMDIVHSDNISHAPESSMPDQIPNILKRIEVLKNTTPKKNEKLPVTGDDLKLLGLKPGPLFGQLLDMVKDKQLENPNTTKEEYLDMIKLQLKKEKSMQIARQIYDKP